LTNPGGRSDELNLEETSPVIQQALQADGKEIKAYGIGEHVYAFEKELLPPVGCALVGVVCSTNFGIFSFFGSFSIFAL